MKNWNKIGQTKKHCSKFHNVYEEYIIKCNYKMCISENGMSIILFYSGCTISWNARPCFFIKNLAGCALRWPMPTEQEGITEIWSTSALSGEGPSFTNAPLLGHYPTQKTLKYKGQHAHVSKVQNLITHLTLNPKSLKASHPHRSWPLGLGWSLRVTRGGQVT